MREVIKNIINSINEGSVEITKLQSRIAKMNTVDIADIFEHISKEKVLQIFRILPKDIAADVFSYIEPKNQQIIIEALSDAEIGKIMDDLFVDDAVDFLEEMPANVVSRALANVTDEKRQIINQILQYPEDSAGSVMTTEYVYLRADMTVLEAFDTIRATGLDKETIYTCYVITRDRMLIGVVAASTMMLSDLRVRISDIMDTNLVYAYTTDDREVITGLFKKYGFLALPVVDKERRLVGIVTVDDAVQIIEDENTEDFEKMAALNPSDEPYLKTSVFKLSANRIIWLLFLMLSATITGSIISSFEDSLAILPVLVAFIPMLMDTGGNAGAQASTLVIRGMALEEIRMGDILRVLWRELRVGILCGLALSLINFVRVFVMNGRDALLSFTISISLFITVVMAKSVGCALPIIAKKFRLDPAIMAAPLITTIVDAAALIVYFALAKTILHI